MKTVSRVADVFSVQSWAAQTAWPWLKRAYFLQGFLFAFAAFQVIGNGLVWLLLWFDSLTPSGVDAMAALPYAWLTIGVLVGIPTGLAWDDASTSRDRLDASKTRLFALFKDNPAVAGFTFDHRYHRIRVLVKPGADVAHINALPTEVEGWMVDLIIYRRTLSP